MQVWRLEQFKSLVGQSVSASVLGSEIEPAIEMKVVDVVESTSLGEGWESFSVQLKFEEEIGQGNYQFEHDEHGKVGVFITPHSETEGEAVFSYQLEA